MTTQGLGVISVGVDVSKATADVAVLVQGEMVVRLEQRIARSSDGVATLLGALGQQGFLDNSRETRVVMEATGPYSNELARWLLAQRPQLRVAVVNPVFVKGYVKSLGLRNKTDRVDARALAGYGLERDLRWFSLPDPTIDCLRELSRERDAIVREIVAVKNRQDTAVHNAVAIKVREGLLKSLEAAKKELEKEALERIAEDPQWQRVFQLAQTIPGVGPITALVLLAELGDARRFNRSRQFSAFVGLSPQITQSGTSVRKRTRLCKIGNARTRQALFLAAMAAVRKENDLSRVYHRLVDAGKPRMVALGAVMRKLLLIYRALVISGARYSNKFSLCTSCG